MKKQSKMRPMSNNDRLEDLHRQILPLPAEWLQQDPLDLSQPSLLENVDSVGTPGTDIDDLIIEGIVTHDAELERRS